MKALALCAFLLLTFAVFGVETPKPEPAKDARQLLQEGLFEEEANRDLQKAGEDYAAVMALFDAQRSFAATALFRLAEVRAKQGGKAEAIALYQRLLTDFSGEEALVKLSRERLAALGEKPASADGAALASDDETKEINRLRQVIIESPDLINGDEDKAPLEKAASHGWTRAAAFLIEHGAKIRASALVNAAEGGHKAVLELLVSHGGDVNAESSWVMTPLGAACEARRLEIVRFLLGAQADPNRLARLANPHGGSRRASPLMATLSPPAPEIAALLLEHGADPNLPDEDHIRPLDIAVTTSIELTKLLLGNHADPNLPNGLPNSGGATPLMKAIFEGVDGSVELLLAAGAKPDSEADLADMHHLGDRGIPLIAAILAEKPKLVKLLLEHGANPNFCPPHAETPLNKAIETADAESVHLLLAAGADPNAPDFAGFPPLRPAVLASDEAIVKDLLDHGARADAVKAGDYPLLYHAVIRSPAIVRLLLDHGANATAVSGEGWTPLHISVREALPEPTASSSRGVGVQRSVPSPRLANDPRLFKPNMSEAEVRTACKAEIEIWGMLLAKGADVNARASDGSTPLFVAAARADLPVDSVDWLIAHGAEIMSKNAAGELAFAGAQGERRLEIERRYLFPKWAASGGLNIITRGRRELDQEPARIEPLTDFDVCPSLCEALEVINEKRIQFTSRFSVHVYRPQASGEFVPVENFIIAASMPFPEAKLQWPALRWADILVIEPESGEFTSYDAVKLLLNNAREVKTVTVQAGERTQALHLGLDRGALLWSATDELLPAWTLSDLVLHAVLAAPAARLDAVKIERLVDGKPKEWTVDLRPGSADAGKSVKPLHARLADGDRVTIPLKSGVDPEALSKRRSGLFLLAPGGVLGLRIFHWSKEDPQPYTLCELLTEFYGSWEIVVPDPDLSHIVIHRVKEGSGESVDLNVDLLAEIHKFEAADPAVRDAKARLADLPLEWGDIVELRTEPGKDAQAWTGFDASTLGFFKAALERSIQISMPGVTIGSTMTPTLRMVARVSSGPETGQWKVTNGPSSGFGIFDLYAGQHFDPEKLLDVTVHGEKGDRRFTAAQLKALEPWIRLGDESLTPDMY